MADVARQMVSSAAEERSAIPTLLVRDLLAVALLTEGRPSARSRLDKTLGGETAASMFRQALSSTLDGAPPLST